MGKDTINNSTCKKALLKNSDDTFRKKVELKVISHNFTKRLMEKNPESKLFNAYKNSHSCSDVYIVEEGKAHTHYCHRHFCSICQRIQMACNINKFLPVMKYLVSKGKDFYFVTLTLKNCVTDDVNVLRDFMCRCNKIWSNGIRTKQKFRSFDVSGVIKKECTYHVVKGNKFSFHYHFHLIMDSLKAVKYIIAQWKKIHGNTIADARFQQYKKINGLEKAALEIFKYTSKTSVSYSRDRNGKKKSLINYKALDMIYTAMYGMQRMSGIGKFRTLIGDEVLNDFKDEDLKDGINIDSVEEIDVDVSDGYYSWYISVKSKLANWYNVKTGESLCFCSFNREYELLQDVYLGGISPPG